MKEDKDTEWEEEKGRQKCGNKYGKRMERESRQREALMKEMKCVRRKKEETVNTYAYLRMHRK